MKSETKGPMADTIELYLAHKRSLGKELAKVELMLRLMDGYLLAQGVVGALANPSVQRWFDLSAFPLVPTGSFLFGNSGRNILDGPGRQELNLSLQRNFQVRERYRFQFRWEGFNVFNHTNLTLRVTTVDVPNAGTITGAYSARVMQLGLHLQF